MTGGSGIIGSAANSQGTVIVTGASTWNMGDFSTVASSGTGTLTIADGGTVVSSAPITVAQNPGSVGTLNIGAAPTAPPVAPGTLDAPSIVFGSLFGAGAGSINFNHTATNYMFATPISGPGAVNVLAGTTHLTATNTYTGPTTVSGGALFVDGSLTTSDITANGGTLAGIGTVVNNVQVNAGTFAPGNGTPSSTMMIGSLAFASAAQYMVFLNASTSSLAKVTGTASLNGTVVASVLSASNKTYLILQSGGLGGSRFSGLELSIPNFAGMLSYSPTDVFLNLRAQLGAGASLTENQQNVANPLTNIFNSGGVLPPPFQSLFGLTGSNLTHALDQISGEPATGAQQAAFQLGDQFLNVMLDPFVVFWATI